MLADELAAVGMYSLLNFVSQSENETTRGMMRSIYRAWSVFRSYTPIYKDLFVNQ